MRLLNQFRKLPYGWEFLALIAGGVLPLAFAPCNIFWLALLSPAVLLASWLNCSPKQAFKRGLGFGIGFFGIGTSWVFNSIYTYGNTALLLAVFITAIFTLILALFIAIHGYFLNRYFINNSWQKLILAFPASWVLFEWLRSWLLFNGFPWLFLGYSQINTPLRGLAPLVSVYGISFFTAFTSATLVCFCNKFTKRLKTMLLLFLVVVWSGSALITTTHWTQPQGKPLSVSLIQGNVPILMKWDVAQFQKTLLMYKNLSEQNWDSQIIVWPEGAVTLYNSDAQANLDQLAATARQHQTAILTGIPIFIEDRVYNGMQALGKGEGTYLKQHLVPFGEYLPLEEWLGQLLKILDIPMSNFSSGPPQQTPIVVQGIPIASFICYEIAFPNEVLTAVPNTQLIVNIIEDGWFGHSFAAAQQLQMAQMRALETGRYLLSITNSGITAIINPQGKIITEAPQYRTYVLKGNVQAMIGRTPIMYCNIYPWLVLMTVLLIVAYRRSAS